MPKIVAFIEDQIDLRTNIAKYISIKTEHDTVMQYGSIEHFIAEAEKIKHIDILLLDIGLPGMTGIEGIPLIKEKFPLVDIIMLTTYEESDLIVKAIFAGACSYISKRSSLQSITDAVQVVADGGAYMSPSIARKLTEHFQKDKLQQESPLSDRQKEVVEHIVEGKSYRQIAESCYISVNTVRSHIKNIYAILNVKNKVGLMNKYHRGQID